jgi:hypothetical protein
MAPLLMPPVERSRRKRSLPWGICVSAFREKGVPGGQIRGLIGSDIARDDPRWAQPATLIGARAQRGIRDRSDSRTPRLQGDGLCGPSVVLQSSGIESGIEVVLISGQSKFTIVAAFQVEPLAGPLARPILLPGELLRCVVRHDGCTYAERG